MGKYTKNTPHRQAYHYMDRVGQITPVRQNKPAQEYHNIELKVWPHVGVGPHTHQCLGSAIHQWWHHQVPSM